MILPRLIPALLLRRSGLWKSVNFRRWSYVGDAVNAIKIFNEKEVDELVLLDVEATRRSDGPKWDFLAECAAECFMPLGYGGGVNSLAVAQRVVSLGIEKVVLNHAAWERPHLISEVARAVGSCSTVVCLDVRRDWRGRPVRFDHVSRGSVRENPAKAARRVVEAGAGEVIIQDVDRDGSLAGPDFELIASVCEAVSVPITILGGVASLEHAARAWRSGVSGVAAGSWFVFHGPHRAVLITYPPYEEINEAWQASHAG